MGALGLVVNVIVLWNTLYMDKALAHLQAKDLVSLTGAQVAEIEPAFQRRRLRTFIRRLADVVRMGACRVDQDTIRQSLLLDETTEDPMRSRGSADVAHADEKHGNFSLLLHLVLHISVKTGS